MSQSASTDLGRPANRLAGETSPYLLQHAHNPVDWYPWGPEALAAAKRENKPIFLSIGYSACHWCHVMERESFEDPATAALMNRAFINIKVDREERPDLDQIYMTAVQLLTGHGGWPMSVWLTPDLAPFYGGTYYPPERRYNMPSFAEVIQAVVEAWRGRPEQVREAAVQITERLSQLGELEASERFPSPDLVAAAARELARHVDRRWGGIGGAPKFPHSVELRLLLRAAAWTGSDEPRELAALSLEKMIRGGIYDQLGGGFHRYSTDERWLVPHFEKMLYDNALIPLACLEAFQAKGAEIFERATRETLDYVLREMTDPAGGFYSTQDADSEGVEGKFFVWSRDEIDRLLGPRRAETFASVYDVTTVGNWEDANILNLPKTVDQCARLLGIPLADLENQLAESRRILFEHRRTRVPPGRDDKILTAWNGMMIETFAVAAQVLGAERYRDAAVAGAEFVLDTMRASGGLLLRTCKEGRAHLNAYLEDYAFFASSLVSLYEATFDPRWIRAASEIVGRMIEQFWDDAEGGFFFTGADHEKLIARGKDPLDGATPAANAVATLTLLRLAKLTDQREYREKATRTLQLFGNLMARSATAAAQMLLALKFHHGPTHEIVLAGDPDAAETQALLAAIHRRHLPNKVLALRRPGAPPEIDQLLPLLAGKTPIAGRPTVYICQNHACQRPITELAELEAELDRLAKGTPDL